MGSGDFERRRRPGRGGWWDWRPVQHALHYLWMTGAIGVQSRRHFQKRFDLMERVVPEVAAIEPLSAEAFARWHVERSLHAMGAATEADLSRYLSYPRMGRSVRRAALTALLDDGQVVRVEVEGDRAPWLALARDLPALARARRRTDAARGTTLLSPFDSLLWHRDRVERLFGFSYRIEVYTPGPRRVHGYYTLPILHRGQLVGRVDAKTHRAERWLEVRRIHVEPWVAAGAAPPRGGDPLDRDELLAGIADALRSLAVFVGAARVTIARVAPQRLRPPLARLLRDGAELGAVASR
jgi:uncharacterized protein YcaQ